MGDTAYIIQTSVRGTVPMHAGSICNVHDFVPQHKEALSIERFSEEIRKIVIGSNLGWATVSPG